MRGVGLPPCLPDCPYPIRLFHSLHHKPNLTASPKYQLAFHTQLRHLFILFALLLPLMCTMGSIFRRISTRTRGD